MQPIGYSGVFGRNWRICQIPTRRCVNNKSVQLTNETNGPHYANVVGMSITRWATT